MYCLYIQCDLIIYLYYISTINIIHSFIYSGIGDCVLD